MFGVGNKVARYETMYEARHRTLNRADGVEMATVTDGMAWSVDRMWLIRAHDPKKIKVS